ncbi:MAG: serine/threonine protein kinase [Bacteriovoracaceae bacterium]|nr:serine/threonine protein kinase [Bacteriovoracaceae bacterium]
MSTEGNKKLKRFGKYLLLDHLVDGGMAEIYRSRELAESVEQMVADKIVAVKVIRRQYSQDEKFKTMFIDEIKVAFGLTHPNIAQTYNYGEKDGKLFAVLEYIHGKNLNEFIKALQEHKKCFPIDVAVYITSQICLGLDYAHKFVDKLTGKRQHLIHRDISPHNVMLDYDGQVKVIDFGIAKADTNTEQTQAGTIKGKVAYLAPEYLMENIKLDPRYDQFAVGLTLWEMLFGRRLFVGDNDMAVIKSIYDCKIPKPTSLLKNFPKELENIILKSLSRNRDDRYKEMSEFNKVLTKFLYSNFHDFHPGQVKDFLHKSFKEEITAQGQRLKAFGEINLAPYCKDLKEELEGVRQEHTTNDDQLANADSKSAIPTRAFGATSLTDLKDKTISPFVLKMRQEQQKRKEAKKKK